ncbi:hypothetical protein MKW98_008897 [Papaver atlanticum]|uniref:Uncharacterized protein n=1 Tax=Papaver atlanticum TaxID=357466 RepID=A0AAD4S2T4_9MAGN|nr:hypothetical protein MKW98_008897 [Papaver atlanticum]
MEIFGSREAYLILPTSVATGLVEYAGFRIFAEDLQPSSNGYDQLAYTHVETKRRIIKDQIDKKGVFINSLRRPQLMRTINVRCRVEEPCLLAWMDLVRFELSHSPEVSFGVTSSRCCSHKNKNYLWVIQNAVNTRMIRGAKVQLGEKSSLKTNLYRVERLNPVYH